MKIKDRSIKSCCNPNSLRLRLHKHTKNIHWPVLSGASLGGLQPINRLVLVIVDGIEHVHDDKEEDDEQVCSSID